MDKFLDKRFHILYEIAIRCRQRA